MPLADAQKVDVVMIVVMIVIYVGVVDDDVRSTAISANGFSKSLTMPLADTQKVDVVMIAVVAFVVVAVGVVDDDCPNFPSTIRK